MARKKKAFTSEEDEPDLDISSLIDVCFLLLIYFIVTQTIQPQESDLQLQLPSDGGPPSENIADLPPILIKVDASGAVYKGNEGGGFEKLDTNTKQHNLPMLSERLGLYVSTARSLNQPPLVQVWVDGEARQQRVIDVLNLLAFHKIDRVTFTDLVDSQ